ncbi:TIGR03089 family protein [Nocardia sp. NPDC003482]
MCELNQTLTGALLDPILARDPAGPRITYYDDALGARIELSALTLANWAAKTANMIRDEFGVQPGGRVAVLLPAHWQTAAVLLGCWWAGTEVVLRPDPTAEMAFTAADRVDDAADIPEVAVLSLDPMGGPARDLPVGVVDYATSVRVHPDQFHPTTTGPALEGASVQEVLTQARASAKSQSFTEDSRVLSTTPWTTPQLLTEDLLAIYAAGASLVQVTNPTPNPHRLHTEHITHTRP